MEMDQQVFLPARSSTPRANPELEHYPTQHGTRLLRPRDWDVEAWPFLAPAADNPHELAEVFLAATSEAEALDYLVQLPAIRDDLPSISTRIIPFRLRCSADLTCGQGFARLHPLALHFSL